MFIFDFDGVIVDSLSICRDACQFAGAAQGNHDTLADNPFLTLSPLTFEAMGESLNLDGNQYAADVMPVGVAWGWQQPSDLRAHGAQFIAETPAELLTILQQEKP